MPKSKGKGTAGFICGPRMATWQLGAASSRGLFQERRAAEAPHVSCLVYRSPSGRTVKSSCLPDNVSLNAQGTSCLQANATLNFTRFLNV